MRLIGRAIQVLVGLAILVGLVALTGWIIYVTVAKAPAVVAAVVTGLGALIGLAVQRYLEQQREDHRERRERMAPIYEQLVRTFYDSATRGEAAEENMLRFFEALAQSLLIWGSASVIGAFNRWRIAVALNAGAPESLFAFEDLLFAVREDLGNDRKNLGRGDLLRVFINDVDDFLAPPSEEVTPDERSGASSMAA